MAERKRKEIEEEIEAKASKAKMTENMQKQSDAIIGISSTFKTLIENMGARGIDNQANGSNELQDTVKEMKDGMTKQSEQIAALAQKQDELVKTQGDSFKEIMNFMQKIQQKFQ